MEGLELPEGATLLRQLGLAVWLRPFCNTHKQRMFLYTGSRLQIVPWVHQQTDTYKHGICADMPQSQTRFINEPTQTRDIFADRTQSQTTNDNIRCIFLAQLHVTICSLETILSNTFVAASLLRVSCQCFYKWGKNKTKFNPV